jgi:hypothetical protein
MKREDLEQFIETLNIEEFANYVILNGIEATMQKYRLSRHNVCDIKKKFQIKVPEQLRQQRIRETKLRLYGTETYNNAEKASRRFAWNVSYEQLYDLYITQNLCKTDVAELLGVNCKRLSKKLSEYNIIKPDSMKYYAREQKTQQTNLKRYGVKHPSELDEFKKKARDTCIQRYGADSFFASESYRELFKDADYIANYVNKANKTKRKNNTFNTSKSEEKYYVELCQKYNKSDIYRNYKCERYPFYCDFYIPSEDLFIELNAHWTHGGKPYDPKDKECQEQLAKWKEKAKTSKFYENAIKTWTERDVKKLQTAKENNLNYKVIY